MSRIPKRQETYDRHLNEAREIGFDSGRMSGFDAGLQAGLERAKHDLNILREVKGVLAAITEITSANAQITEAATRALHETRMFGERPTEWRKK